MRHHRNSGLFLRTVPLYHFEVALLGATLALFCSGCSGENTAESSVTGTVTMDGQPLSNAMVIFHPTIQDGEISSGTTDDQGRYTAMNRLGPGAAAGSYKVTVSKLVPKEGVELAEGMTAAMLDPEQVQEVVPAEYVDPAKTQLTAEIKPGENHGVDFAIP